MGTSPQPPFVPENTADAKPCAAWSSTGRAEAVGPLMVNEAYHAIGA
jgi:hypothetical protein